MKEAWNTLKLFAPGAVKTPSRTLKIALKRGLNRIKRQITPPNRKERFAA